MASWDEFERAQPAMAAVGRRLLEQHQLAYLGTTRKDGSPRVHPVCPLIAEGRLFVATQRTSPKRFDLLRDGRYALHMLPGAGDSEFRSTGKQGLHSEHLGYLLTEMQSVARAHPEASW